MTVEAWGGATVRASHGTTVLARQTAVVEARGGVIVRARDSATVRASKYVPVVTFGDDTKVEGGVVVRMPEIATGADWCDFYGVDTDDGVATLYKAVDEAFSTQNGVSYEPGSIPEAPDWDGGESECGGGLHLSPRPFLALRFKPDAERFVACPVRVSEIVVHTDPVHPDKVKARRACAPVYEVDIEGSPVE